MMFFGRNKKLDAAAKQEDAELELAISARIAEVVRVAETTDPTSAPRSEPEPWPNPAHQMEAWPEPAAQSLSWADTSPASVHAAQPDVLSAISEVEALASNHGAQMDPVEAYPAPAAPMPSAAAYEYDAVLPPPAALQPEARGEASSLGALQASLPTQPMPARSGVILRASQAEPLPAMLDSQNPFALTPDALAVDALMQETSKHLRNMGSVNILVAGQTGVGKSTLINSVFGEQFAKTAAGQPVTQRAEWYTSDTVPLRILDTRGLEAKDYAITLHDMRMEIETLRNQRDERNQLHMAWVCISSPSSRVQDCEVDIVRVLNKYDIPAIIVLTKDDDDPDFAEIVAQIMDERRAVYASIVPVRALQKPKRPAAGLEQLVVATFTALPAAHRSAFAAAQKINRDLNKVAAEDYVTAATSAAAAAAVIPLPFADMVTLAPIQASMLVGISSAFGLTFERAQVMQLITTVLGCLALSTAGGWAVGTVLKFIPGPGSVLGAVLNATVAGALTKTLGHTYIRFLYSFIETHGRVPTAGETIEVFPAFFRTRRAD